ncbi:MAG: glycosyltransferase [Propionibacteriaceae bacterium]|jgi:hypothetical protein|nr:glycosyltransferase [Propionibacteriaceae bacterium]
MSEAIPNASVVPLTIVADTVAAANEALQNCSVEAAVLLLSNHVTKPAPECVAELLAVAELSDRHGIVIPRISRPDAGDVAVDLPRAHPVPHWDGCAMLIRAELLDDYGLLDESYADLTTAGAEFSLRVNRYGYSTVRANQAVVALPPAVAHDHGDGVGAAHEQHFDVKTLEDAYPYVSQLPDEYAIWAHPVDEFEPLIASADRSVLIYLGYITPELSGTSRNVVSFLNYVASRPDSGRFSVYAENAASEFFSLSSVGLEVLDETSVEGRQFALGYVPFQVADAGMLEFLMRHCLRTVVTVLDVIWMRTNEHLIKRFYSKAVFHESLEFADGIVAISQASQTDTDMLFGCKECSAKIKVIPQGCPDVGFASSTSQPGPYQQVIGGIEPGFAFISGNRYPHKRVDLAVAALRRGGFVGQIVCLGAEDSFEAGSGLYVLRSGVVPEDVMETIRRRAGLFIFPSSYEGFGFPIAEAARYGKPIIATDMPVMRETAALFPQVQIRFFSRLDDLAGLANEVVATAGHTPDGSHAAFAGSDTVTAGVRSLADYDLAVAAYLEQILAQPIDAHALLYKRRRVAGAALSGNQQQLQRQLTALEAERVRQAAELETGIKALQTRETELEAKIEALLATSSWKITAPLRALTDKVRRVARGGSVL